MKIVAGAALIAGAVILDVVTWGAATPLVVAAITTALSLGASLLLGGIADALTHNLGTGIATRQAAAPQTYIYGRSRVGGNIVYVSLTGTSNRQLNLVIVHCSHSVKAIPNLYLDGKLVVLASGTFHDDGNNHFDDSGVEYNFKGKVWWETRLGSPTQTSFSDLTGWDPNWPSTATLSGHACSYIALTYDAAVFPNGIPGIRVDIIGKNDIYDPRTATNGYTENWALCVADVLTNKAYGLQCDYATEINNAQLIAAANICDETINLQNGDTEPRYTCNGTIQSSQAPGDILSQMMTGAAGRLTYINGQWGIYPASYVTPSLSLSDAGLLAPIKWQPKRKYRDLINAVKASFICPTYPYVSAGPGLSYGQKITGIFDGQWQQTDMPPYFQDTTHGYGSDINLANDGNTRLWLDTRFPFTISVAACQRIAKIMLLRNRQQGQGTLVYNLTAYQAVTLDTILYSHSRFGWTNKILEITQMRFNFKTSDDGTATALYVELDVCETDPSVYAWSSSEELAINDNPPPQLPNMAFCQPPSGLTLESDSSTLVIGADGIERTSILVTWVSPTDAFITRGGSIEMQFQITGAATWNAFSTFSGLVTRAVINGTTDGANYTVQIRSVNTSGAYSDWISAAITVNNAASNFSGSTTGPSVVVTGATPVAAAGQLAIGSTVSSTATAGTGAAAPSTVQGYLEMNYAGTVVKVPYFQT